MAYNLLCQNPSCSFSCQNPRNQHILSSLWVMQQCAKAVAFRGVQGFLAWSGTHWPWLVASGRVGFPIIFWHTSFTSIWTHLPSCVAQHEHGISSDEKSSCKVLNSYQTMMCTQLSLRGTKPAFFFKVCKLQNLNSEVLYFPTYFKINSSEKAGREQDVYLTSNKSSFSTKHYRS